MQQNRACRFDTGTRKQTGWRAACREVRGW